MVWKHDVIHKTGSTWRIATPSEENRATATGNMHKKLAKFGRTVFDFEFCVRTGRQTDSQTDTQTDILIERNNNENVFRKMKITLLMKCPSVNYWDWTSRTTTWRCFGRVLSSSATRPTKNYRYTVSYYCYRIFLAKSQIQPWSSTVNYHAAREVRFSHTVKCLPPNV